MSSCPPFVPLLPLAVAATFSACATAPKPAAADPVPQHDFIEDVPMESTANVQRSADIRAYPVGRYMDAANKDVMHERHIIYRRERPEQWRINADQGAGILLGPTVGLRNPVALTNPSPQTLTAELNKQRIITRQLLDIQQRAASGDERARELLSQAAAMKDNQDKLVSLIQSYNTRVENMQRQLDTMRVPSASPAAAPPGNLSDQAADTFTRKPPGGIPAKEVTKPEVPTGDLESPGFTLPFQRR